MAGLNHIGRAIELNISINTNSCKSSNGSGGLTVAPPFSREQTTRTAHGCRKYNNNNSTGEMAVIAKFIYRQRRLADGSRIKFHPNTQPRAGPESVRVFVDGRAIFLDLVIVSGRRELLERGGIIQRGELTISGWPTRSAGSECKRFTELRRSA